ncbi:MAG: hypothetical protein ACK56I_10880, partial [bacterium]
MASAHGVPVRVDRVSVDSDLVFDSGIHRVASGSGFCQPLLLPRGQEFVVGLVFKAGCTLLSQG